MFDLIPLIPIQYLHIANTNQSILFLPKIFRIRRGMIGFDI